MRFVLAVTLVFVVLIANAAPKIFPSGESVPENLLHIELELDQRLATPLDMTHVSLFDQAGKLIADPFLDLPLPSRDGKRITILLHPGRIKTGVGPNIALGMALYQDEQVTLVIADPQFTSPFKKSWFVQAARRQPIDPRSWNLVVPTSGSREPLQIKFPSALSSRAQDLIAVAAPDGHRMAGRAVLSNGETHWGFVPDGNWKPGQYELRVHPSLEDPEGNRICSAFEQIKQSLSECRDDFRIAFEVTNMAATSGDTGRM